MWSAPQVSRAWGVTEAGVDGLVLQRAEQEEESAEGGTLGSSNSPGPCPKGALQSTYPNFPLMPEPFPLLPLSKCWSQVTETQLK